MKRLVMLPVDQLVPVCIAASLDESLSSALGNTAKVVLAKVLNDPPFKNARAHLTAGPYTTALTLFVLAIVPSSISCILDTELANQSRARAIGDLCVMQHRSIQISRVSKLPRQNNQQTSNPAIQSHHHRRTRCTEILAVSLPRCLDSPACRSGARWPL